MVRLFALIVAALTAFSPAQAQRVSAWTETVISVGDLQKSSELYLKLGNWRIIGEDEMDKSELAYWKLPEGVSGRYRLICAPKADTGCIRFIRIDGAGEQRPIRAALRPWDTGGIFSTMVRSDNVDQLYTDALAMGWWAESPPIRFQFGTSDLKNVVLTGPHGVHLAVYERIMPEFDGFPVGRVSQGFNSMRMVKNKDNARDFYIEKLGFDTLFDSNNEFADPAFSNLSIPYNYTTKIKRIAVALYPVAGETGRVELMQIEGFTGHDVSAQANLPNLGIISVRYPVEDLEEYRRLLEDRGVKISYAADDVSIGQTGVLDLFAVRDTDGNLTEFYERHDGN